VLPATASIATAWDQVTRLSRARHLDAALVTLPPPTGVTPERVPPGISTRDRAVEAGRRSGGLKGRLFRLARRLLRRDRKDEDDRPVLVHLGDERSFQAIAVLAPWARLERSGRGAAVVIGGGAVLDDATLHLFEGIDSPRMERIILGAATSAATGPEWADLAGTCLRTGMATAADAARLQSLGVATPPDVVGHPADRPESAAAVLAELREEVA